MAFFEGAYESRDMSLETMTEGISVAGMRTFSDLLEAKLLRGVSDKLAETQGITEAIKAGWQGEARDAFLMSFEKGIKRVQNDLNSEYQDLMNRLGELMDSYFNQDKQMLKIVEE